MPPRRCATNATRASASPRVWCATERRRAGFGGQHRRGDGYHQTLLGMIPAWSARRWLPPFRPSKGHPVVVVDVGANVDSTPQMLAQFGIMGETYSRARLPHGKPRVGVLSSAKRSTRATS